MDGSYTAYSNSYEEHYHSTKDGALSETLIKHVIPAYELKSDKKSLYILDICFGLGYNTLATIWYFLEHKPEIELFIYSPELDGDLINSLVDFEYPKEFSKEIITTLSKEKKYHKNNLHVELFIGDAVEYVKGFDNFFDVIYQDAFSPEKNPKLWTKEYFGLIANASREDAILTSYSTSFNTRYNLYTNGFFIYDKVNEKTRDSLVASKKKIELYKKIDMEHKIKCNLDSN
ncbi:tRNA (5-methylaminomethyl-2-thiouridine)(34)-methyltransferase MnmD [Sulfurospirillum sp. 1307]